MAPSAVISDENWYHIQRRNARRGRRIVVPRLVEEFKDYATVDSLTKPILLECLDDFFHQNSAALMPDLKLFEFGPIEQRPSFPCQKDSDQLKELEKFHPEIYRQFVDDDSGPAEEAEDDERVSGLCLLSIVLKFLELNSDFHLLIAGHCDTTGTVDVNFDLSELRARNVQYLLEGKRDEWVGICLKHSKVEDVQRILLHFSINCTWGCCPGLIDNIAGEITKKAIKNFQAMYNQALDKNIAVDGVVGKQTWGAVFDLYQNEIASVLDTTADKMDGYRNALRYVNDAPILACSELFPIEEEYRDNYYSAKNRRVDVLFYHKDKLPSLEGEKEEKANAVYGSGTEFDHLVPVMRGTDPLLTDADIEYDIESLKTEPEDEDELEIETDVELSYDPDFGFLDDLEKYCPPGLAAAETTIDEIDELFE